MPEPDPEVKYNDHILSISKRDDKALAGGSSLTAEIIAMNRKFKFGLNDSGLMYQGLRE